MSIIDKVEVDGTIYDIVGGGILPHLVISTDSGLTVTVTKGTTTITATETSEGIYECDVTEFGTYAISDTENTIDVIIDTVTIYQISMTPPVPEGATVTPTDDIDTWIKCAGLENTNNYTSLVEVMADTELFDTLLRDSNACDYMARSTTWAKQEGLVPTMTSATTPSGKCISNGDYSGQPNYQAFDKNSSTTWSSTTNFSNSYIGYTFTTPTICKLMKFTQRELYGYNDQVIKAKVQASFDESSWTDISEELQFTMSRPSDTTELYFALNPTVAYTSYRLFYLEKVSGGFDVFPTTAGIQFYADADITTDADAMARVGKYDYCADALLANATWCSAICNSTYVENVLNVKVPTMTSATTPSGEVSASGTYSSYYPYYAFDGNNSSLWWGGNGVVASWIQYHFTEPVKIYCVKYIVSDNDPIGKRSATCKIQASNDGGSTLVDVTETITNTTTGEMNVMLTKNLGTYSDYRWQNLSSTYEPALETLQFYGRHSSVQYSPLVPVMTSNTTPSGECFGEGLDTNYYNVFDGNDSSYMSMARASTSNNVGYDFTKSVCVKKVGILISSNNDNSLFSVEGSSDQSTWTPIDDVYAKTTWTVYDIDNNDSYRYYRVRVKAGAGSYSQMQIYTVQFYQAIPSTTKVHSCPNDTLYITDGVDTEVLCTTDSNGIGSIDWSDFDAGTYNIFSSVAKNPSNLNLGYHKAVRVTNTQYGHTTDAYIMPDGALYWYGYKCADYQTTRYNGGANSKIVENTNNLQWYDGSSSGNYYDGLSLSFNRPVKSGDKLRVYATVVKSSGTSSVIGRNTYPPSGGGYGSSGFEDTTTISAVGIVEVTLTGSGYPAIWANSYLSCTNPLSVSAIWIE